MRRTLATLTLAAVLLTAAAPGAAAAAGDAAPGDRDGTVVEISDLTVTIADAHLEGTGLPERSVGSASYTVQDATVATDGFTVDVNGETHRIGAVTIVVDDVGLELQDVTVGAGE